MRYICKITRSGEQKRISLPKVFLEHNKWDDEEYLVIDDRDIRNIKLRRLDNGKEEKGDN